MYVYIYIFLHKNTSLAILPIVKRYHWELSNVKECEFTFCLPVQIHGLEMWILPWSISNVQKFQACQVSMKL